MPTIQTTLDTEEKYPLPRGFSPSHIIGYRSCPRQFFIRYVLKIRIAVTSPILEMGSRVHDAIARQMFESDNPEVQAYLNVAKEAMRTLPSNPVLETTYEDKNNPGRFFGRCFSYPFAGTFDIHWLDPAMGADWKTGSYKERKNGDYEIQAYLLNELFKQKYGFYLTEFRLIFLKDGYEYYAKSLIQGRSRTVTEKSILNALRDIHARRFPRKESFACGWCEVSQYCRLNCGVTG